jgi:uncharacterized repeat protein (TIGR03837 family)
LWIDDLSAFQQMQPEIQLDLAQQLCNDVTVCAWPAAMSATQPAEVVIEAFGCVLPEIYVAAMAAQSPPPVWVNLEYLSAESWVADHHGLPSPHPQLPLTKYFFFPGYDDATGGLLRERDLLAHRERFLLNETAAYWQALGLAVPAANEWRVSLFAYENPALAELLDAWAAGSEPVTLLVPEGRILSQLADWLGEKDLQAGAVARHGVLEVRVLPFTSQDGYDRLLWACDFNFVRGEDSCVRAQWAARPLVWQAYPQAEAAHFNKLEALLACYTALLAPAAAQSISACWRRWNGVPDAPNMAECWSGMKEWRGELMAHAAAWQMKLAQQPSLADALVAFAESKRSSRTDGV